MHDRRIDGETHIFGNAGSLFMNAMTWYDHATESVWSQPWGRALNGKYAGTELFLLPSQITTWRNWRTEHPESLVLINDVNRLGGFQRFDPDFVIGLLLANEAKAYYYRDVAEQKIINDHLGQFPVLLWAADNNFHAFVRQVDDQTLTFRYVNEELVDLETASSWDIVLGLATGGPLKGQSLQQVPSTTAYDWAWMDFFPSSSLYQP